MYDGNKRDSNEVTLSPDGFTVHASEKVSTGKYESANVSMTIEGEVEGVDEISGDERKELHQRLLEMQRDLQRHVEQAAKNRTKIRDAENWEAFDMRWGDDE